MTFDEIVNLPIGRDLEFPVARALGWTDIRPSDHKSPTGAIDGYRGISPDGYNGAPADWYFVPEYSRPRGRPYLLEAIDRRPSSGVYEDFRIYRLFDGTWKCYLGGWFFPGTGFTFSEAVCRAILFEHHQHRMGTITTS